MKKIIKYLSGMGVVVLFFALEFGLFFVGEPLPDGKAKTFIAYYAMPGLMVLLIGVYVFSYLHHKSDVPPSNE